jgi:peroxiredoxin family protein
MIAAILESGELERVSTGLSLLVSAASDGRRALGLASYGALAVLLDPDLQARALTPGAAPHVSADGRAIFARTLAELRDTALAMEGLTIWACAAAVETTGADRALVDARLAGVLSTPRFLREAAGAELVVL